MFRSEPSRSDAPSIVISAVPDPTRAHFRPPAATRRARLAGRRPPDRQLTRRRDLCGGRMDGATELGSRELTRRWPLRSDGRTAAHASGARRRGARTLAGGGLAGVYLTDVEGVCLLRLAGDAELPERMEAAGAVGPEFDAEGAAELCAVLARRWPDGSIEPLWVLGRALGVLVTTEPGGRELAELARFVAPFFELAGGFTDTFERGRRREQPSAAAEMQLELLPPRIARVAGGHLVASVLPAYDVGGDWFDHAENPEGVWLAIGDAMGKGIRAAAMSAVSIGAFRSARREGGDPQRCSREMHRAVFDFGTAGS